MAIFKEFKFVGKTGYETEWAPIPKDGFVAVKIKPKIREKLGRTYGVSIRTKEPDVRDE